MWKEIRGSRCLIVFIYVCVHGESSFKELQSLLDWAKSSLWECVSKLSELGVVNTFKVLSVIGKPKLMVRCTEEGRNTLKELSDTIEVNLKPEMGKPYWSSKR